MAHLVIDIETIPTQNKEVIKKLKEGVKPPANIKKQESIDKWYAENSESASDLALAKTSFNGGLGEIFCIGFSTLDGEPEVVGRKDLSFEAEKEMLINFNNKIHNIAMASPTCNVHFIGHNLSEFDLRFVFQRLVAHQVKPRFTLPVDAASWKNAYTDTMTLWAGYKNKVSLDNLCGYLGVDSSKNKIDGSMVWEYVQDGKWEEVQEYCKDDVRATEEVYHKLTFDFYKK